MHLNTAELNQNMKRPSKKWILATRPHAKQDQFVEDLVTQLYVSAFLDTMATLTNVAAILSAQSIPIALLQKLVPTISASIHAWERSADITPNVL